MLLRRIVVALFALVLIGSKARAQDPNSQPPAPNLPTTINVYLDCVFGCDFDYVRTEIPYVNWVNDRTAADVHLLGTTQDTGGGGTEFTFNFIGQRGFAQTNDTLKYIASVDATSDDRRRGYTRLFKVGLVPFLARTSLASRLQISVGPAAANQPVQTTAQHDRWRGWVFNVSANAFTNGEKSYTSLYSFFDGQASRITERWKSVFGGSFQYDDSKSTVELGNADQTADTTYVTIKRNWQSYASQYKGINQHWSLGVTGEIGSNTYSNQGRYARAKAGVEYDLFPYKESTRRQLRMQYGIGGAYYSYQDTTIYLKTKETVPIHYVAIATSAKQPWGSLSGTVMHNALVNDPSKRSTRLYGNANIRIVKGLSVFFGGEYDWIHDQLYLRKGTASTTSVLLRQQALKTSYSYYGNFGLSYTFGSIFNNVVFPRFGGNNTF